MLGFKQTPDLFKRRVKNHLWKIDAWASIRISTVHAYIHTYIHTYTYMHTYIHTCIHTCIHAYHKLTHENKQIVKIIRAHHIYCVLLFYCLVQLMHMVIYLLDLLQLYFKQKWCDGSLPPRETAKSQFSRDCLAKRKGYIA